MSTQSRRELLFNTVYGLGGLTLAAHMPGGGIFATPALADSLLDPLSPKQPHFPPKVKSVIWLHMDGAPSTLDLYDYKPDLIKLAGQETPPSFLQGIKTSTQGGVGKLFVSNRTWKQYGESGAWFSDLLPNLAQHADKLTFIKSSTTIGATHDISDSQAEHRRYKSRAAFAWRVGNLCAGFRQSGFAGLCRALYGQKATDRWFGELEFGVFCQPCTKAPPSGQAIRPILDLDYPELIGLAEQRDDLDLLKRLNEQRAALHPDDTELQARIRSYELAYRMESTAPEAVDLSARKLMPPKSFTAWTMQRPKITERPCCGLGGW